MPLPPCHSRRDVPGQADQYFCAHPGVHVEDNLVTAEVCQTCALWQEPPPAKFRPVELPTAVSERKGDCTFLGPATGWRRCPTCRGNVRLRVYECLHPWHDSTTIPECQKCAEYQSLGVTRQVSRWSVGVTTAPRAEPTLARSLASLREAGWDEPHVFAEPDVDLPSGFEHLVCSRRPHKLGAFPNWYLALTEMYLLKPHAEAYLLCQDDVLFAAGLRDYLEQNLWPAPEIGVVSVYCPSHYAVGKDAGFCCENRGLDSWGALAYLFSNPSIRRFLSDPQPIDHRHHGFQDGLRNIDSIVGNWCKLAELPYYVHNPSLAQHIGDTSTLGLSRNSDRRHADRFLPDVRQFVPGLVLSPLKNGTQLTPPLSKGQCRSARDLTSTSRRGLGDWENTKVLESV